MLAGTAPGLPKLLDEMFFEQECLPFHAASCACIASQDIDNRSRGAAIDPESFRDSAYAPRHPIDLAPHHIRFACS